MVCLAESDRTASFSSRVEFFFASAGIGALTGGAVSLFKLSIAAGATALYGLDTTHGLGLRSRSLRLCAVPILGGLLVSAIRCLLPHWRLGPGLAEHVAENERGIAFRPAASAGRTAAAVATLCTGNSLGPEGPAVEIGVSVSRLIAAVRGMPFQRRRQLLAAGAAAGVSAGFNAPLAGVFFALEVGAEAVRAAVPPPVGAPMEASGAAPSGAGGGGDGAAGVAAAHEAAREAAELDVKSRTAISGLVLSSLLAGILAQAILGRELALRPGIWARRAPLAELPLFLGLGAAAGGLALIFQWACAGARALYRDSDAGGADATGASGRMGREGGLLSWIPLLLRPASGALGCALLSLAFPQVLFFGYDTLDAILASGRVAALQPATALHASAALSSILSGHISIASALPTHAAAPAAAATAAAVAAASSPASRAAAAVAAAAAAPAAVAAAGPSSSGISIVGATELLIAKVLATALCAGSGLVGGTFAPSLFMGTLLGVVYHSIMAAALSAVAAGLTAAQAALAAMVGAPATSWVVLAHGVPQLTLADAPAYAMIGAAATLAAVFRAPLTATLLLFELTRAYEIVLPLLAAAGTAPLVVEWASRRMGRADRLRELRNGRKGNGQIIPSVAEECDLDNQMDCQPLKMG